MSPICRWYSYPTSVSINTTTILQLLLLQQPQSHKIVYLLSLCFFSLCLRVVLDQMASANPISRPCGSSLLYVCVFPLTLYMPIICVFACIIQSLARWPPLSHSHAPSSSVPAFISFAYAYLSQCSLLEPVAIHSECFDSWRSGWCSPTIPPLFSLI